MLILRVILGTVALLFGGGFVVLALLGSAFRQSFGASGHGPLFIGLPAIGVAILFAAILFPGSRPLLHVAAVTALALAAFCLWQILAKGEAPLWIAVAYLAAWLLYYWLAAWRGVAAAS
ncbi:MAG TPA: hypothetical protein PKC43_00720 [Phycisphaerales bacterium]|nr:hypothetical protein [Phycisphaerales bacterium]HMP35948.1 hypothetical protein [Phycisphaerales bacterium]